jgi:hypothetical protein
LKRKIISKLNVLKENIKENLNHVNSKVSLTCDIWSSISGHPYLAIAVHFINEKFRMKNFLLDFDLIHFPRDGQQICNKIKEILSEFNFETRFIAITTDNAKNNVKGIRLLQTSLAESQNLIFDNFHFRCFAHILNLCVRNGINEKEIKDEIDDLRSHLSFIKDSPKRLQILEERYEALNVKFIKPKIDIITRWDSTFDMINRALQLKSLLIYLTLNEKEFRSKKISENSWSLFESLKVVLESFNDATNLSNSKIPTINLVIPNFSTLSDHLRNHEMTNPKMKNFIKNFEDKFFKYKENIFNDISIISTTIDPRFKLDYFKESEHYETFKQKIENVFEIYNQKYTTTVITQTSEDSTNYSKLLFKRQKTNLPKS